MSINITFCDDERVEITYLTALVHKWASARDFVVRLSDYESAESFLFAYEDDKTVDILLLDIQMKDMNGVELARQIRKNNEAVQIIFITGYPDFMAQGYEVSALHYLMKPIREDKLFEVLDRAVKRLEKSEQTLLIQTADTVERVLLDDILFMEAFAHYVVIHTKSAVLETRAGISEMEQSAGNAFVRCHRSYIVALNHINRITKTDIMLDNGKVIPLSRRLYVTVNRAFIAYHKRG